MDVDRSTANRARERAIFAFSTGYIFERRSSLLGGQPRLLSTVALLLPLLFGGIVIGFGANYFLLPAVLGISIAIGVVQLVGFGLSLTHRWEDRYAYSLESKTANYALAEHYSNLAKARMVPEKAAQRTELLDVEYAAREAQDNKQEISDEEKRMGMCAALRQYRWACAGCGGVPISMDASACPVCGKFKFRKVIL